MKQRKQWKPKWLDRFYAIDIDIWSDLLATHTAMQGLFRTRALRQKALKDIKKVLKEAQHG